MSADPVRIDSTWSETKQALLNSQTTAAAGQYAAAIMHEINNPLEAIANLNYLIKIEAENATKVREYSCQIGEQLQNVVGIARRTLSFYRPPESMEAIELAILAEAALRVHQPRLTAKRANLVKDIAAESFVHGHAGELLQVLSNLLSNSIDALSPDGRLTIRVRRRQEEVHLTVADDGHGISDETRQRIFEPFFTTKKERGTGLGLTISKSIIERHKGRIRIRTSVRPGRTGTAFRVSLPLHKNSVRSSLSLPSN